MGGPRTSFVLVVLGVALVVGLLLGISGLFDLDPHADSDTHRRGDGGATALESGLLKEMRREATLRGMPGVKRRGGGHGALTGAVKLHAADAEPRPLAGVKLQLLGYDRHARGRKGRAGSGTSTPGDVKEDVETAADGTFLFPKVPALIGYALVLRHPPYKEIVLRGLNVSKDRTTDVGTLLLGAPTSLLGEVLDHRGRPLSGAVVRVMRDGSRPDRFDLRRGLVELESALTGVATTSSGGDGRFVVRDLPPGRYVLRVSARGFASAFKSGVLVTVDEQSTSVRVVLDAGVGWAGHVRDEDGRGVGNARLIAVAIPGQRLTRVDREETRSAGDGSYRLDTLVPGVRYFLETWAEGHAPSGQFVVTGSEVVAKDVTLLRSGRVEGRVFDEDSGAPIPEAEVMVVAGSFSSLSPVSTVCDKQGAFALPNVSAGPVLVFSATADGYQQGDAVSAQAVQGLKVVAGETTWVEWPLRAGGLVAGRVTGSDGKPVAYATVALADPKRRFEGEITAMTDERGTYEIPGVRPATYELHVSAPGYAPLIEDAEARVVMGPELGRIVKDVQLARGAALYGVVTAPDGTLLRGARVWVEAVGKRAIRDRVRDLQAVSGAAGAYRIQGVPPALDVRVHASHDAYVDAVPLPQRLGPAQQHKVDLALREGVKLPGRVVDVRGHAVANARIRWGSVEGVKDRDLRDSFRADGYLGTRVLRTDADGRFLIEGLGPGRLLLKVEHDGFAAWYRRDLVIGSEGPQPALTAELEATLTIRGRITGRDTGLPLERAFVYARERGPAEGEEQDPGRVQAVVSAETAPDGSYVLEKVPPGTHEVVVWFASGYVAAAQKWRNEHVRRKDVPAGATGIDFALEPIEPPATPEDD